MDIDKKNGVDNMKCSSCHENTAIVFITKMENGQPIREGLCLPCAQKQGLAPLDAILQQTGMSQDEFNNINEQMSELFEDVDMDQLTESFMNQDGEGGNQFANLFGNAMAGGSTDDDEEDVDSVKLSGSEGERQFSGSDASSEKNVKTKVKSGPKRPKRKKNLDNFGINLNEKKAQKKKKWIELLVDIGKLTELFKSSIEGPRITQSLLENQVLVKQLLQKVWLFVLSKVKYRQNFLT